jgi:hypothetical protein
MNLMMSAVGASDQAAWPSFWIGAAALVVGVVGVIGAKAWNATSRRAGKTVNNAARTATDISGATVIGPSRGDQRIDGTIISGPVTGDQYIGPTTGDQHINHTIINEAISTSRHEIPMPSTNFNDDDVVLARSVASWSGWSEDSRGRIFDAGGTPIAITDTELAKVLRALDWFTPIGARNTGIAWSKVPTDDDERSRQVRSMKQTMNRYGLN